MMLQLVLVFVLSAAFLLATAKGVMLTRTVRRERAVIAERDARSGHEPEPLSEPKAPRDVSRPYPRPKGSRSKLNRVCPVCGTDWETGDLDGKLLGWPAHASCAEWLGDWHPRRPTPPPFKPDKALIGSMEQSQKPVESGLKCNACGVLLGTGVRYHDQTGHLYCPDCDRKGYGHEQKMVANRIASVNDVRERLNQEIIATWGVPPAILGEHTHKVGDPLPIERCPDCGAQFCGLPDYLRSAYKLHRQLGCSKP